jgi:hypothetical protein
MFGSRHGPNDSNQNLYRTFRAFTGHYFLASKIYSFDARGAATNLRASVEICVAACVLRVVHRVAMELAMQSLLGIPGRRQKRQMNLVCSYTVVR